LNTPGPKVERIDVEIFELHNELRKDPKCLIPDLE
jgi:hypothetical protein